MNHSQPTFWILAGKSAVVHTVTYFLVGLIALTVFDYRNLYADVNVRTLMRQVNDPLVMAGPLFQPLRGVVFAIAFFPFRQTLFGPKRGWLLMALLLIALGVVATFGPAPGSIEGLIYTVLPVPFQLIGLPEVLGQALLFSFVLWYWVNHSTKKWLGWVLGVLFVLILFLITLGLLVAKQ